MVIVSSIKKKGSANFSGTDHKIKQCIRKQNDAVECHTHARTRILATEQSDWNALILACAQTLCGEVIRPPIS